MCNNINNGRSQVSEPDLCHLHQDLREDLGHDLRYVLRQDLRPDLRQDLRLGLRIDLRQDLREDLRHDLRHGLRQDLRRDLRPDLRRDLHHDLRHDLRRDLSQPARHQPHVGAQFAPSSVDGGSEADALDRWVQQSEGTASRRVVRVAGMRSSPRDPSPDYFGFGTAPGGTQPRRREHSGVSVARQSASRSPSPSSHSDDLWFRSRRH